MLPLWARVDLEAMAMKVYSVLKLNIITLTANDGMAKVNEKLKTLFFEDMNQLAFMAYKSFNSYQRQMHQ